LVIAKEQLQEDRVSALLTQILDPVNPETHEGLHTGPDKRGRDVLGCS
jgi:hypothetical protein